MKFRSATAIKLCFTIFSSFLICSCSSTIKLDAAFNPSTQYFVLQMPYAKLYFRKADVIAFTATPEFIKISTENPDLTQFTSKVRENSEDTLSFPIVRDDRSKDARSCAHALLSLYYIDLIKQRKFLVYDTRDGKFQNAISVKKEKSEHGSWLSYRFLDGREFYHYIISRTEYSVHSVITKANSIGN
jgi:hypothetical protein